MTSDGDGGMEDASECNDDQQGVPLQQATLKVIDRDFPGHKFELGGHDLIKRHILGMDKGDAIRPATVHMIKRVYNTLWLASCEGAEERARIATLIDRAKRKPAQGNSGESTTAKRRRKQMCQADLQNLLSEMSEQGAPHIWKEGGFEDVRDWDRQSIDDDATIDFIKDFILVLATYGSGLQFH